MRTLVCIPTYNERDNVEGLVGKILALGLDLHILFVDDASPDGTGTVIDRLVSGNPAIHVIHRPAKQGIGTAHLAGIRWAYDHGVQSLVTMDCDGTHPPEYIPALLENPEDTDIVVGSRFLGNPSLDEWVFFRKMLTGTGHLLTRTLLRMKYDATGAFRHYRLDRVPREAFDIVRSTGYSFFFESLYILNFNHLTISEIPINLPARTQGNSKMTYGEIGRSVWRLVTTLFQSIFNRRRFRIPPAARESSVAHSGT